MAIKQLVNVAAVTADYDLTQQPIITIIIIVIIMIVENKMGMRFSWLALRISVEHSKRIKRKVMSMMDVMAAAAVAAGETIPGPQCQR